MKTMLRFSFVLVVIGGLFTDRCPAADLDPQLVIGNTGLALDLYGRLRTNEGNGCFSPYSISTALAMTYGGARDETAKQMARTLHFALPPDQLHPAFAALEANFKAVQQKGRVQLEVANSLWPQKDYAFLPEYLDLCRTCYHTSITSVDYAGNTESARKTINDWVEDKTNGKIIELLKPGILDQDTRLVLVNAIYFKGNWASQFDVRQTRDEPFHVSAEKTVTAPLMRQTSDFRCAEFPDLQVLELPYLDNQLVMQVVLPRQVDGLGRLEAKLTKQNLTAWTANLQTHEMAVILPRFNVKADFSLVETLKAMGMFAAFGPADFSGMDGRKDLFLSEVRHAAFVKVNEEGTEAAATTAAMATLGIPPRFRTDHPFLFLIRDLRSGSILFLGRVTNPTQ